MIHPAFIEKIRQERARSEWQPIPLEIQLPLESTIPYHKEEDQERSIRVIVIDL